MKKMFMLLIVFILAIGSLAGYLILTEMINEGHLKITAGEKQLAAGEQALASGKVRLANGEQAYEQGKQVHQSIKLVSVMALATVVPIGVYAVSEYENKVTGKKLSEGRRMIDNGKEKIAAGEERLSAGKLALKNGTIRLNQAVMIRNICGMAAIFFGLLFIIILSIRRKK